MSYGLMVQSALGTIQIDEQFVGSRLVQSGTFTTNDYDLINLQLSQFYASPPLVLVRPTTLNSWIGAFWFSSFGTQGNVDNFTMIGEVGKTYEYAIFAIEGTPIDDGSTHGLRVWNGSNQITFSTSHTRARITHTFNITTFPECVSTIPSYSLSGYTSIPWVIANNLYSYIWNGEDAGVYNGFLISYSSYNTARMSFGGFDGIPTLGCEGSGVAPAPYPFTLAFAKTNEGA